MDEMNTSAVQTSETNNEASKPEAKVTNTPKADDKPTKSVSIEEQLQQLLVENAKLKRASEKANSEAADYKKKYNATLSEQERASQEKAEEQARRDERLAELERENSIHKFTESFLDLGYDKETAIKAATAQVDGDVDTLFTLQKKVIDEKVLAKEQELIKDIPRAKTGVYSSMTAEQIMAIPDREERRRAINENIELFS
jgi:hypothetical protein